MIRRYSFERYSPSEGKRASEVIELNETETSPQNPFEVKIALVNPWSIGTHELCLPNYDFDQIDFSSGYFGPPIAVGETSPKDRYYYSATEFLFMLDGLEYGDLGVIDGVHRLEKARRVGLAYVPVQLFPLRDPRIFIGTWLENFTALTANEVASYFKHPDHHTLPKATKFQVQGRDAQIYRISQVEPNIRVPISLLT